MPDTSSLPTVEDLLAAYQGAVSTRRETADVHRGGRYDALGGVGAILFRRISSRARDAFRADYFDTAQDVDLDELESKQFSDVPPRVLATKGQGVARLERNDALGGAGTLLSGTRISLAQGGATPIRYFEISSDRAVGSTDLKAWDVPIQCADPGALAAISAVSGNVQRLAIEDALWDNTWRVVSLDCASGTDREKDSDYRLRTKSTRTEARNGYVDKITKAMRDAGATKIALFASDYLGPDLDFGLNKICVGDDNFSTTDALLTACRLAVYDVCVLGTAVQVLPMSPDVLSLRVSVTLWDTLDHIGRGMLRSDVQNALLNYFQTRKNPFLWRIDAMEGVALKATRQQAQSVVITPSVSEPVQADLFSTFPLIAWNLDARRVTVSFS